jgi:hypothetical protein
MKEFYNAGACGPAFVASKKYHADIYEAMLWKD